MKGTEIMPTIQSCWIPVRVSALLLQHSLHASEKPAVNVGLSERITLTLKTQNSKSWCGALNENVSHGLRCLNT